MVSTKGRADSRDHAGARSKEEAGQERKSKTSGGPPAIATLELTKKYGDKVAVDGLTFKVPRGSIFGFLGPNGAGKSTTMRMLMTLLSPTSGRMKVLGMDPTTHPREVKGKVGYLPEEPIMYEKLSGAEHLDFIGRLHSMPWERREARVKALLRLFSLEDVAGSPIESYSKGMRQKVALAATLVHDPELLLLDEPTTALDPRHTRAVKDIVKELNRRGKTVVLSTHILGVVEEVCTHVAIIHLGQLVYMSTMKEAKAGLGKGEGLEDLFISLTGGRMEELSLEGLEAGGP
jgi:ABC-2 type transport system ATP-binding protein